MEIGDTVCRLLRIFGKGENGVAGSSRWARLEPSELVGLEVDSYSSFGEHSFRN